MATSFNIVAISKLLKLTERRVQQLAKDGIIPKAERGKYDLVSSVHGYVDFLKAKAGGEFTAEEVIKNKNKLLKAKYPPTSSELANSCPPILKEADWIILIILVVSGRN